MILSYNMNTYGNTNSDNVKIAANEGGHDTVQCSQVRGDIDKILEQEATRNNKETWSKLDKTTKISKLIHYANKIGTEKEFSKEDNDILSNYLIASLERKRLLSVKDVIYDNVNGEIKNIPSLIFSSTTTRKYTLKRLEKRTSTLKSLGQGKGKKKVGKIDMVRN